MNDTRIAPTVFEVLELSRKVRTPEEEVLWQEFWERYDKEYAIRQARHIAAKAKRDAHEQSVEKNKMALEAFYRRICRMRLVQGMTYRAIGKELHRSSARVSEVVQSMIRRRQWHLEPDQAKYVPKKIAEAAGLRQMEDGSWVQASAPAIRREEWSNMARYLLSAAEIFKKTPERVPPGTYDVPKLAIAPGHAR